MTKYDPALETRIEKAISFIKKKNPGVKKATVARQFTIPYRTLNARLAGRIPQNTKGGYTEVLTSTQNTALREWISLLILCSHQAIKSAIRKGVNSILQQSELPQHRDIKPQSTLWASRWLRRNKEWFKTIRASQAHVQYISVR
ncbi:hypothetical protein K3495_g2148 [Podosphaera aphanis]|nr:hypothetical protein K3495_g2148 [Podosphaera aphanis]